MAFLQKLFLLAMLFTIALNADGQGISEKESRQLVQFRHIGHQLLLAVGDSSSRVMPVEKTGDGSYRLTFEKPFRFLPDSLANVTERLMQSRLFTAPFTLTVTVAGSDKIVYGFTSDEILKGNVPCIGRQMPLAMYVINIQTPVAVSWNIYITLFSVLLITISVLAALQVYKTKRNIGQKPADGPDAISIGNYQFIPTKGLLVYDSENISLTAKERTLLNIFLKQVNQVIDRNLLLKEGWEDEGVITGRSLDMYVSKLRKKLQKDASISIKNVHGKGYSLNIDQDLRVR